MGILSVLFDFLTKSTDNYSRKLDDIEKKYGSSDKLERQKKAVERAQRGLSGDFSNNDND